MNHDDQPDQFDPPVQPAQPSPPGRIDQALLQEAQRLLGTASTHDTVEAALALAIRTSTHQQAVDAETSRLSSEAQPPAGPAPRGTSGAPPSTPVNPTGDWLLDPSVIATASQPGAAARLRPLLEAGRLCTCALVDAEVLGMMATPAQYERSARDRRVAYRDLPMTADAGARLRELQASLARKAHVTAASARDLLVAATAMEHDVGVLHHNPAFTLLGQLCGLRESTLAGLGGRR